MHFIKINYHFFPFEKKRIEKSATKSDEIEEIKS